MSIRTLMLVIFLIFFFAISLPLLLIAYLIGLVSKKARYTFTYKVAGKFFSHSVLTLAGAKVTVKGLENLQKKETVLFVGNHKGLFDIPLLIAYVDFPISFISKKSYQKVPLFNWWMVMLGCLFLDRENTRNAVKTILEGIEMLKNNQSLAIFPEGTRSKTNELLPFKQGSLKLAGKANVPIIPFYIGGTNKLFENHPFLSVKGADIRLTFGEPIYLDKLPEEHQRHSAKYVQSVVASLGNSK